MVFRLNCDKDETFLYIDTTNLDYEKAWIQIRMDFLGWIWIRIDF